MKTTTRTLLILLSLAGITFGQGFTDGFVTFYGEVRKTGGAGTVLLQEGKLEVTFSNQAAPGNKVTVKTSLSPTGRGEAKPYSYALRVPLAYLPEPPRLGDFLSIRQTPADFQVEGITINDQPATLPDGSGEFFPLSFASRGESYRLDLIVRGDSTDSDGDGLPDWWERMSGLNPDLVDSDSDPDGDGWSNLSEFLRGSDPQASNLNPELTTLELTVPEMGTAGCLLQFHDSDSAAAEISLTLDLSAMQGFRARLDGTPLEADRTTLTASALQSGRLTISHLDTTVRSAFLPLTWTDGGSQQSSGIVRLLVSSPSSADGNDAALWLDAAALPVGEALSSWNDRSGNARNAMQPLAEHQPLVVPLGSHQSVYFHTPTAHLFFQDEALPAGEHTILAAWHAPDSTDEAQSLLSSNRGFLQLEPTTEAVSYPGAPVYQADDLAVRGYESSPGHTSTSIFRRENSTLLNIFGLSYNGEQITAESLDPVLPTIGARRLAVPAKNSISHGFAGSLHELLIFPTALPEQKLRDVHDYLQSKWSDHVIWDFSTNLRSVQLSASTIEKNIIRGGHGNDDLEGGSGQNVLSGGPGSDILRGSPGRDTFVFGSIDTGSDLIVDFDPSTDVIDLSSQFWGETGDAREFLSTRLETRFDTQIPTLDTILVLLRPGGERQEIALKNTVLGPRQVVELIVEGHIRMGALSIPTEVHVALAPGSREDTPLPESLENSFSVEVTRTGDGSAGALEVPLGLFGDALGNEVVLEGDVRKDGQRAVVSFGRGETSKLITFRPLPDLQTEGLERWQTAILPHFRYSVSGESVARSVRDDPMVHVVVTEPNALTNGQPGLIRIVRDGTPTEALTVRLELDGTAREGTHINPVPRAITIPAGQVSTEVPIKTLDGWNGTPNRMAMLRLEPGEDYLVGSPHEATVYTAASAPDPQESRFDRWLTAATGGEISSLTSLLQSDRSSQLGSLLQAYAAGRPADDIHATPGLTFRLVGNRPVLNTPLSSSAADLHWQVEDSDRENGWRNVSDSFARELSDESLTLIGPPRDKEDSARLYRLVFTVTQESRLAKGIEAISSSSRYGLRGSSSWRTDPTSGHLTSESGAPGSASRLIVEIDKPTLLEFEMSLENAGKSDSLTFFINGEQAAQTSGHPTQFRRQINPSQPVFLMWEYRGHAGRAVIGNLNPASAAGQQ